MVQLRKFPFLVLIFASLELTKVHIIKNAVVKQVTSNKFAKTHYRWIAVFRATSARQKESDIAK